MNSDIPLATAAIFCLSNLYCKHGTDFEYVMVDFTYIGLFELRGTRGERKYKLKNYPFCFCSFLFYW